MFRCSTRTSGVFVCGVCVWRVELGRRIFTSSQPWSWQRLCHQHHQFHESSWFRQPRRVSVLVVLFIGESGSRSNWRNRQDNLKSNVGGRGQKTGRKGVIAFTIIQGELNIVGEVFGILEYGKDILDASSQNHNNGKLQHTFFAGLAVTAPSTFLTAPLTYGRN